MSSLRIVLDTNVLVAGMLNPQGPPGRILDLLVAGEISLLYDDRILGEYRAVLARNKFDFDPAAVTDLLERLITRGMPVASRPLDIVLPDADDLPCLEVATSGHADALVTGNLRHFPAPATGIDFPIEEPARFVDRLKI